MSHQYSVKDNHQVICCPFCMSPNGLSVEFAAGDRESSQWQRIFSVCTVTPAPEPLESI